MNNADIERMAAALYDGGWRDTDFEELAEEFDLTDEEAEAICDELLRIEED